MLTQIVGIKKFHQFIQRSERGQLLWIIFCHTCYVIANSFRRIWSTTFGTDWCNDVASCWSF